MINESTFYQLLKRRQVHELKINSNPSSVDISFNCMHWSFGAFISIVFSNSASLSNFKFPRVGMSRVKS